MLIFFRAQGRVRETGGTSASAPVVAGLISMLNEERMSKGLPALGFVNPRIYGMPMTAFVDVVDGNTGMMNTV